MTRRNTNHNGHGDELPNGDNRQQSRHNLPASLSLISAAEQDHSKGNQRGKLDDKSQVHQEADTAPHGAEGPILAMTVVGLRKRCTATAQTRTAFMETV